MLRCALCTLLIAAAGLGVGCTNANPSLFVLNNAKPDEMCKISGDLGGDSDVQLTRGRWDVQPTGARYVLNLRVANNSMQNANEVRSNTNDVHMLSAEVEALNPDGVPIPFQNAPGVMHPESVPNPFVVPLAGGTVAASKDGDTGRGLRQVPSHPQRLQGCRAAVPERAAREQPLARGGPVDPVEGEDDRRAHLDDRLVPVARHALQRL